MAHNVKVLAQGMTRTHIREYIKEIPEKGITIKEIRENNNFPYIDFSMRRLKEYNIVKPLKKASKRDNSIVWGRGPEYDKFVHHLDSLSVNLKYE